MIEQVNKFVTIEAGIGVGKSTFLPKLVKSLNSMSKEHWEEVQEPVENPEFDKLLRKFYEEPTTENRIIFQHFITDSRSDLISNLPSDRNYLIERSLLSDLIFCQINFLEMEAPKGEYMSYYYYIKEKLNYYPKLNACVYLQCDPRIAYERMRARGREAEKGVKYKYLEELHGFHDVVLPQACRVYNVPLLRFDWNHFGSSQQVAEELLNIL